jgi:hypothetical protein
LETAFDKSASFSKNYKTIDCQSEPWESSSSRKNEREILEEEDKLLIQMGLCRYWDSPIVFVCVCMYAYENFMCVFVCEREREKEGERERERERE